MLRLFNKQINRTYFSIFVNIKRTKHVASLTQVDNSSWELKRKRDFEVVKSIKECGTDLKKAYAILMSVKEEQLEKKQIETDILLRSYNAILHACSDLGDIGTTLDLLKEMKEFSHHHPEEVLKPDATTYRRAIFTCAKAKKWQLSLQLLREMELAALIPDVKVYGAVISACGGGGQWEKAIEVFNSMITYGVKPNVIIFTSAISACDKCNRPTEALEIFRLMKKYNVKPNVVTFGAVISICAKSGQWQLAMSIFNSMKYHDVKPNTIVFNSTINACAKSGQWQKALEVFKSMDDAQFSVERDAITYLMAISACEKGGQWERALKLLEYMEQKGEKPNELHIGAAISACGKSGQWEKALQLFHSIPRRGIKLSSNSFGTIITACKECQQWETAYSLLKSMESPKYSGSPLKPNVICYSSTIAACEKAGEWKKALQIFDEMQSAGVAANGYTLVAVISAYSKGNLLDKIPDFLFSKLQDTVNPSSSEHQGSGSGRRVKPSVFIVSAAMTACIQGGQCETALELFDNMEMKYGVTPNIVCYNSAIRACSIGATALSAAGLFPAQEAVEEGGDDDDEEGEVCQPASTEKNLTISSEFRSSSFYLDKAFEYFSDMQVKHSLKPDVITYSTMIDVCEKSGQLVRALELLHEMEEKGLKPNSVSFGSVMSAFEKQSMGIPGEERALTIPITSKTARKYSDSVFVSGDAESRSNESLVNLKDQHGSDGAMETLRLALNRGVYAHVWVNNDTIDLHNCTSSVAKTVIKYFLKHYRETETFPTTTTSTTNKQKSLDVKSNSTGCAYDGITLWDDALDAVRGAKPITHQSTFKEDTAFPSSGKKEKRIKIITGKGNRTLGGEENAVLIKSIRTLLTEEEGIPVEEDLNNKGAFFIKVDDILK